MRAIAVTLIAAALAAGCSTAVARRDTLAPPAVTVQPPAVQPVSPRLLWVPAWNLYVMEGYDVVYLQGAYYYFHNGRWWLAKSYTGPWASVATPPSVVAKLPPGNLNGYLRPADEPGDGTPCPPGQAKKARC